MNYPIGIQDFASIINDGFVYVDKTNMVYELTKDKGVYFLSRPRRFGKSLLVSTIKYYFEGRHDLFKGLKIESLEKKWETYPVFEIDFNVPTTRRRMHWSRRLMAIWSSGNSNMACSQLPTSPAGAWPTCCIKLMYRRVRPA